MMTTATSTAGGSNTVSASSVLSRYDDYDDNDDVPEDVDDDRNHLAHSVLVTAVCCVQQGGHLLPSLAQL